MSFKTFKFVENSFSFKETTHEGLYLHKSEHLL